MITPEQEKWLSHLDDSNQIKILPFDPSSKKKFELIKKEIRDSLGKKVQVLLKGATGMGISGQGELDIYVPTLPKYFDTTVLSIEKRFGKPKSHYPLQRVRFVTSIEGTKVELFVINKTSKDWIDSCKFEDYVKKNPESLRAYEKLKGTGAGLSTREYHRRKIEFINDILSRQTS